MADRRKLRRLVAIALGSTAVIAILALSKARPAGEAVLRIGTSGSLAAGTSGGDEKAAMDTLHNLIKSETGLDNQLITQHGWQELAEHLAKGQLQVGVFQGYEFAWAQAKYPKLHALALAINGQPYRRVFVVVRRDNPAKRFADLKGHKLEMPQAGKGYPLLVSNHLSQQAGHRPAKDFFAEIKFTKYAEDVIDDVVDRVVDAAAVDQVNLETYKMLKPARFGQLKELAQSPWLPGTVIAYYDANLAPQTRTQFTDGLLHANKRERGRTLLTYFQLTGFQTPPADFPRVLEQTRKTYAAAEETTE